MNRFWTIAGGCLLVMTGLGLHPGRGAEPERWVAGFRSGFNPNRDKNAFLQLELFGSRDLPDRAPWRFESSGGWFLQTRLDGSVGSLSGKSQDGFIGTLGPGFTVGLRELPVTADFGLVPTVLTRYRFEKENFGVPLQFTSHAGFMVDVGRHVVLGYRFQHMSNSSMSPHNPGLNLHALSIGYRF